MAIHLITTGRAILLVVAAICIFSSCSSVPREQAETKQIDPAVLAATYAKTRVKFHTLKAQAPTYEMRDMLAVELKALGYEVVGGEIVELPSGMWGVRAGTATTASSGVEVIARIIESREAQMTREADPSYLPEGEQGCPAFKTQVVLNINDASGKPVKSYTGTSKAGDSWSLRSSETSALRDAVRQFPKNDKIDW